MMKSRINSVPAGAGHSPSGENLPLWDAHGFTDQAARVSQRRCNKRSCGKELSFRTGSWLQGSTIAVHILLRFMYYWSREWSNVRDIDEQLGVNHSSVVVWNLAMKEVVTETLVTNRVPLGGPGLTVQMDGRSTRKGSITVACPTHSSGSSAACACKPMTASRCPCPTAHRIRSFLP
uniref:Transposase Helix-turn-helix domain-containing protein n=1 Tax=Trichuris muris TaxID=70415 RepID=A0A5S6QPN1_TRIMR